ALVLAPAALVARPAHAFTPPQSFADLAQQLLPAVVNISSSSHAAADSDGGGGGGGGGPDMPSFPPGSPFEKFFHDFMDRHRGHGGGDPHGDAQPAPERRLQSLGSGFIIDPSGIIVTNNHVIEGADEITVTLQDNTSLKATLIGRDERADLAVLEVKSDKKLPSVAFGDSDKSRVGDWVLAIGNPFGLGGTVTAGIVSARGRDIHQGPYDDFIQTDAAINRGNSGGPLFNMSGEVIGINTAIYSPSGGSIGIGFSIPSDEARKVVADLREFGRVRRGWLGVRIQQVTPDIAESLGLHEPEGALVAGVNEGGPAEKASIKRGDVILKFNNADVKEMKNLPRIVADTRVGESVPVTLWRDGHQMTVQVAVGELPDEAKLAAAQTDAPAKAEGAKTTDISGLGLRIAPINDETRGKYSLGADQNGVVITDVTSGGAAADRGLKPGDVIVEVQQEQVASPADVASKVDAVRKQKRKSVLMLIQSSDGLRWVPLSLDGTGGKPG
ncbi:DegQ family serine endoprotease, partial [Acidisphaera rubrifaciens]|uniref:DegQ family serine endoprotease n=1 Tax=Acidisphaera rubrifaciens TaxID=50715 RepID=UPI000662B372